MGSGERVDGQNKAGLGNSEESYKTSWVGEVSLGKEELRRKRAYGGRRFMGSKAVVLPRVQILK